MNELKLTGCPVCGSQIEKESYDCPVCGAKSVFVRHFTSRDTFVSWKININRKQEELMKKMQQNCINQNVFALSNKGVACISPADGSFHFISKMKEDEKNNDIVQFSASERHSVTLLKNGKVRAEGDNDYGQCNVYHMTNVVNICAAARCTYAVTQEGKVIYAGAPVSTEIAAWNNISKVSCGTYHIIGITKDGSVKIAGSILDEAMKKKVLGWKNVIDVVGGVDCTAALTTEGKVLFAGKEYDTRKEAENWKNVTAIALESLYLVGLNKNGQVLLAGTCKNAFLDLGRQEAKNWKDIVAISCSRSGIAALSKYGKLHIAGNVQGKKEIQETYQENCENSMKLDLIKSAAMK